MENKTQLDGNLVSVEVPAEINLVIRLSLSSFLKDKMIPLLNDLLPITDPAPISSFILFIKNILELRRPV